MRTVRFNVQMRSDGLSVLRGLELKANAHEMVIHGRRFDERTLLFRSHSVLSRQGELAVVEMVLQELDETFPANKRASQAVADLHLLLQDMTVPNVAAPAVDAGQAEVLEDDVSEEQPVNPKLLGMDANFDDDSEDKDDGSEPDSSADQHLGHDPAAVGETDRGCRDT